MKHLDNYQTTMLIIFTFAFTFALVFLIVYYAHNYFAKNKKPKQQEAPQKPKPTSWVYNKSVNVVSHKYDKVWTYNSENEFGIKIEFSKNYIQISQLSSKNDDEGRLIAALDSNYFSILNVKKETYPAEIKPTAETPVEYMKKTN